jgi:hypothetical protein
MNNQGVAKDHFLVFVLQSKMNPFFWQSPEG